MRYSFSDFSKFLLAHLQKVWIEVMLVSRFYYFLLESFEWELHFGKCKF